jgi:DNA-binding transcriptional ArsR family regulator
MTPEAVVKLSKALADPTRFRLLQAIAATEEIACGALAARFPITRDLLAAPQSVSGRGPHRHAP